MKQRLLTVMLCAFLVMLCLFGTGCDRWSAGRPRQVQVVTTLFPLYDFARQIGGERVHVTLLLPPGVEPHDFEPRPSTARSVQNADVFIYTNAAMEPWAEKLLQSIDTKKLVVVDASAWIKLLHQDETLLPQDGAGGQERRDQGAIDPHVWLDLENAQRMARNIFNGLVQADPASENYYRKNLDDYLQRLQDLDAKFSVTMDNCPQKLFVHGGHYTCGYLAKRYGLTYVSAYGLAPDAEPTPKRIAELVSLIKMHNVHYVFTEELLSPKIAKAIAQEAGVTVLPLNAGHNLTRDQFLRHVTFIDLMEEDLRNLKRGLQ